MTYLEGVVPVQKKEEEEEEMEGSWGPRVVDDKLERRVEAELLHRGRQSGLRKAVDAPLQG